MDITLQMSNDWYINSLDNLIKEGYIDFDDLEKELNEAIQNNDFKWKAKAIEFNLIYSDKEQFTKKNLIDYLNSDIWKWCEEDEIPSKEQKQQIEDSINRLNEFDQNNINTVFDRNEFDWLNFGIKQQLKIGFSIEVYENRDIIHHLKNMCWNHLFPDHYKLLDKVTDSKFANEKLRITTSNDG